MRPSLIFRQLKNLSIQLPGVSVLGQCRMVWLPLTELGHAEQNAAKPMGSFILDEYLWR